MYTITDEQIEFILNDIRRRGVETEDLQLNLLDHVCCIIEHNLDEHDGFEAFYERTIKQFYKSELRELEEETIHLLTFKNYYAMKKLMMISGVSSAALFIVGSVFKVMWWPGANIILLIAMLSMGVLFLPLLFILKIKETNTSRDKVIMFLGALVGIMYTFSILFQVQHWQGKHELWLATIAISFFGFIPVYFFTGIRNPATKMNTIVSTILLVSVTALQFTMTGLHPVKGEVKEVVAKQGIRP